MAQTAGKNIVVKCSLTDANYQTIGGLDNSTLDLGSLPMDTTAFGDLAARSADSGIKKFDVSISGKLDAADAGQAILKLFPALVWVTFLWDGTNGYKCQCALSGPKIGGSQSATAVTFSASFTAAGGASMPWV